VISALDKNSLNKTSTQAKQILLSQNVEVFLTQRAPRSRKGRREMKVNGQQKISVFFANPL
jgi:hypothetical protein